MPSPDAWIATGVGSAAAWPVGASDDLLDGLMPAPAGSGGRGQPAQWREPGAKRRGGRRLRLVLLILVVIMGAITAAILGRELLSGGLRVAAAPVAAGPTPDASLALADPAASPSALSGRIGSAADAAAAVLPSVVTIVVESEGIALGGTAGVGSGVVFDAAGWILTNRHVVEGAKTVTVIDDGGVRHAGTVYGLDSLTDLAIVRVEGASLPAAEIGDSSDLRPGDPVLAIGSPLGSFTGSVTTGIVSALGRSITASSGESSETLNGLIQTDAAINPGNSGGPLIDLAGRVIGVDTAVSQSAQGIGFAIPIDVAKPLLAQARAGKPLARPFLGVRYLALPPDPLVAAPLASLPPVSGALLLADDSGPAIGPGGPADRAGLLENDVITEVDGQPLDRRRTLDVVLATHEPGDTLKLTVWRDGRAISITVTLGQRPSR